MKPTKRQALFITALPVEYKAVVEHLQEIKEIEHEAGTVYEVGVFSGEKGNWNVALVQAGMGNPRATLETERAIAYFKPAHVFFVGVAGGLKDVALRDVVAATKVYGYEYGKAEEQFKPRVEFGESSYALIQRAQKVARETKWLHRIQTVKNRASNAKPRAFIGPIAAGEKLITSTKSSLYQFLKDNFSDALAGEMEGFGFFRAIHANHQVQAMLIRGISDLIDKKSEADASGSQEDASRHAAAFAFEVLSEIKLADDDDSKPDWQTRLSELASKLYPKGPEDQQIWSRAGGNIAALELGSTGQANWYAAISKLRFGGGGRSITPLSLAQTMLIDFENNEELESLLAELK